jgi:hypothetical protein
MAIAAFSKIGEEPCVAARPLFAKITKKQGAKACNTLLRYSGIAIPNVDFKRQGSRGPEPALTLQLLKQMLPYLSDEQRMRSKHDILEVLKKLGGDASYFDEVKNAAIFVPLAAGVVVPFLKKGGDGLPPRVALAALVKALGVKTSPTAYLKEKLAPYLKSRRIDVSLLCEKCSAQSPTTTVDVSESERRIASVSVGLRREVVPLYDHGRPTITGDLPILLLIVNELRTPEARAGSTRRDA